MQYRDYQTDVIERGYAILHKHGLVYLMLDTRLGKTIISLSIAHRIGLPVLFITTKKAAPSIKNDLAIMSQLIPDFALNVSIVTQGNIHKVTYSHRLIIIDEAHGYGAFPKPALRAKFLRELTNANPCILLSATPTPESWSSIYHQLWACHYMGRFTADYANFYQWARWYVETTNITGKQEFFKKRISQGREVADYSRAIISDIKEAIAPICITMTQAEAGFNYDKHNEQIVTIPMPDHLRIVYDTMMSECICEWKGNVIVATNAAMHMSKLHQIASGTVIDEQDNRHILSNHKAMAVYRLLSDYPKMAIFYKFIAEGELLRKLFVNRYTEDWQEFQATDKPIFISQYLSGREGINLSKADAIVFFSIDYAYLSYKQGKDRINAKDRDKEPVLIWLITDDTIEKAIYKKVIAKKKFTVKHFEKILKKGVNNEQAPVRNQPD